MTTGELVAIGIAVLIVIGAIMIYNGLVSGYQQVKNAWSQIDIQLKRRHDLIPNLVNTVKGAMQTEQAQLTAVMQARNQAMSATSPAQAIPAENALTGALRGLMAVVEAYPQLRSQENVRPLMEELSSTENKIAFARQHYNDSVQAQNIRVATFPSLMFARLFGFAAETMFQVPESEQAAINAVPEVKL
ncbi:MAG: LemA family protein [Proteobacteria bacterium]|nr:LemA family protein [Pseudomonadota bacterium]MBI3497873.1 LemA family protein [Pseudomonadota bacterium]